MGCAEVALWLLRFNVNKKGGTEDQVVDAAQVLHGIAQAP